MRRNKSIDIVRAIAVLWIIVYHTFAIACGQGFGPKTYIPVIQELIIYGGEIGVTLFFILSGYGLFCSLEHSFESGAFHYGVYLKKRFIRVAPQYYVHLLLMILIGGQTEYLSRSGLKHILTHILFVHNLIPETSRTISGTLWTMGTIVQFYFFAPLLYRFVKKNRYAALVVMILFTIGMKVLLFSVFRNCYFNDLSREVFTAADNFVVGMFIASISKQLYGKVGRIVRIIVSLASIALLIAFLFYTNGITVYSISRIGYTWHSILAVILGLIVFVCAVSPLNARNIPTRIMLTIADNEYGIYLYQLVIIERVLSYSSMVRRIASNSMLLTIITLIIITTGAGIVLSKCFNWPVNVQQNKSDSHQRT